jgi:HPt (histidine-containing phosphotransfer) domain-containing protein
MAKMLSHLRDDKNLIYLAARLQTYAEMCDARLVAVRQAIAAQDLSALAEVAQTLTECTARLGATRMMKLAIGLQIAARQGVSAQLAKILADLEGEYASFKESLISSVG